MTSVRTRASIHKSVVEQVIQALATLPDRNQTSHSLQKTASVSSSETIS